MTKGIILKIIPLFGSVILFLAWVFQQTLLGDANGELQRIYNAQSVFQTYQSNNAVFKCHSGDGEKQHWLGGTDKEGSNLQL